jgi:glycerol-3-phosphate dehydrogenase (NAD(P)+)
MGYGDNTKAAMMTRGIVEITRLGVALGAKPETFTGLAGMGDLIVTCISQHSRNRRCGLMIGAGEDPKVATKKVGMVVEGMYTTEAAHELAKKLGVDMPITEAIYEVINGRMDAHDAVDMLMMRKRGSERV